MKELSLHILDIIQNSIAADATLITLKIVENVVADLLVFTISDNGKGMSPEFLEKVIDPFTTKRTTRRIGLGIPLLKHAAESTGGSLDITSTVGSGTLVTARFGYSNIDRQPLGNMAETMLQLLTSYEEIDFLYTHKVNENEFFLDSCEIKKLLGGVSLKEPEVTLWLSDYLKENEEYLYNK
ncbi:MAG: ATP-binding protein [Oscillospiraceae bacterium]